MEDIMSNLNFNTFLANLNEVHAGAGFTFCTANEKATLISLAVEENKIAHLPQSWKEELENGLICGRCFHRSNNIQENVCPGCHTEMMEQKGVINVLVLLQITFNCKKKQALKFFNNNYIFHSIQSIVTANGKTTINYWT